MSNDGTDGKYNAHTEPIFQKLKILKFKDMVDQGRENIMFAINKKVAPIGTQILFQKDLDRIILTLKHLLHQTTLLEIIFPKLGTNYQIW